MATTEGQQRGPHKHNDGWKEIRGNQLVRGNIEVCRNIASKLQIVSVRCVCKTVAYNQKLNLIVANVVEVVRW